MFKFLVGTACVVIILAGGLYGWNEYRRHNERVAVEARANHLALSRMCKKMQGELEAEEASDDWRVLHVVECVREQHLSESDFATPYMMRIFDQARPLLN